jgi:hypothetical protein
MGCGAPTVRFRDSIAGPTAPCPSASHLLSLGVQRPKLRHSTAGAPWRSVAGWKLYQSTREPAPMPLPIPTCPFSPSACSWPRRLPFSGQATRSTKRSSPFLHCRVELLDLGLGSRQSPPTTASPVNPSTRSPQPQPVPSPTSEPDVQLRLFPGTFRRRQIRHGQLPGRGVRNGPDRLGCQPPHKD